MKNNICYNNLYNMGTEGDLAHGVTDNIKFYNNTLIGGVNTTVPGFIFSVQSGGNNYEVKNNIAYGNGETLYFLADSYSNLTNFDSDYNCYYNLSDPETNEAYALNFLYKGVTYSTLLAYQTATQQDLNSIFGDPALTVTYNLYTNSPCIDRGTIVDVTTDYNGLSRPQGRTYDIGAYEYEIPIARWLVYLYNTVTGLWEYQIDIPPGGIDTLILSKEQTQSFYTLLEGNLAHITNETTNNKKELKIRFPSILLTDEIRNLFINYIDNNEYVKIALIGTETDIIGYIKTCQEEYLLSGIKQTIETVLTLQEYTTDEVSTISVSEESVVTEYYDFSLDLT